MDLLFVMRLIELTIFLTHFILALYIFIRFRFKGHMRILFYYSIISVIVSFTIFREYFEVELINKLFYLTAINHFLSLSVFILNSPEPKIKSKLVVIFVSIWALLLCILMYINHYSKWEPVSFFSNSGLLMMCTVYFIGLFTNETPIKIFEKSGFWAILGIFFCTCICLPLTAFHYFLTPNKNSNDSAFDNIYAIGAFAYTIMHLFFIKAFFCLMRKEKEIFSERISFNKNRGNDIYS